MKGTERDYLIEHLTSVPAFRALLRSVEARMMGALELEHPILDLGCGDGNFAKMAFDQRLDFGLDPWWPSIAEARVTGMHRWLQLADGGAMPFRDSSFGSVMSNSVLEHIPQIEPTLTEVQRVLKPGGIFVFTTPSQHFAEFLFFSDFFRAVGLKSLSQSYQQYFNRISRHFRTDSAETWCKRLESAGLRVTEWFSYFSRDASHVFDLAHYYSSPSLLYKRLFGKWVIAPFRVNFIHIEWLWRRIYEEKPTQEGAYLFFRCRKIEEAGRSR